MQLTWNPTPGQVALIEGPADVCLTGVVLSADNHVVRIDVPSGAARPEDGVVILASFFQADALYQAKAEARFDGPEVLELELTDVQRIQRRTGVRTQLSLPVSLSCLDGPSDFVAVVGTTIDLGLGGCRVRTLKELPLGVDPTVTIDLDATHSVVAGAHVVDHNHLPDGWEYRIAFDELDEQGARLLADLV